jgi:hypothetical protein
MTANASRDPIPESRCATAWIDINAHPLLRYDCLMDEVRLYLPIPDHVAVLFYDARHYLTFQGRPNIRNELPGI